jgi:hypothetical protein
MLRLYSFTNNWLSDLQKGLQTAHAVAELSSCLIDFNTYYNWTNRDKTIIMLKGGTSHDLENYYKLATKTNYNTAIFREDTKSLNGAATAMVVIVPENIWSLSINDANLNKTDKVIRNLICNGKLA